MTRLAYNVHRRGWEPEGYKKGGSYNIGGNNRLDVYNWLSDIPRSEYMPVFDIVELSFNHGSRKDFFKNNNIHQEFKKGDMVVVEGVGGFDMGEVSLSGDLVRLQLRKKKVKDTDKLPRILRLADEADLKQFKENKEREKPMLLKARRIAKDLKLEMHLFEVEIQADGNKATFYYTADNRVDFRQLIREFASEFRLKIEMRQIGIRQEAAKLGGLELSGRELCSSTWLTNFKSVSLSAARVQNLSINMGKLTGPSGRLKQGLLFELDTYLDALNQFPDGVDKLRTKQGTAYLQKKDIFKRLMWYSYKDSRKLFPLSIEHVLEIKEKNEKNISVEELKPVILESRETEDENTFVDVVGQVSLNALEKHPHKKRGRRKGRRGKRKKSSNKGKN